MKFKTRYYLFQIRFRLTHPFYRRDPEVKRICNEIKKATKILQSIDDDEDD